MSAIEKIEAQQKGKEKTAAWTVGEQLKEICRRELESAEILDRDLDVEALSIVKAEQKIKNYADEQHRKEGRNCVCVTPEAAVEILRKFYGLPERTVRQETEAGDILRMEDFL